MIYIVMQYSIRNSPSFEVLSSAFTVTIRKFVRPDSAINDSQSLQYTFIGGEGSYLIATSVLFPVKHLASFV